MVRRGWWSLDVTGVDELNDADLEHISTMIRQGFTAGEIVQEEDEDEIPG